LTSHNVDNEYKAVRILDRLKYFPQPLGDDLLAALFERRDPDPHRPQLLLVHLRLEPLLGQLFLLLVLLLGRQEGDLFVAELDEIVLSAFRGEANLHDYEAEIDTLAAIYEQLRKQYAGKELAEERPPP